MVFLKSDLVTGTDVVTLTDSFMNPVSDISECSQLIKPEISSCEKINSDSAATSLKVWKEDLAAAQKTDPSLLFCLDAAVSLDKAPSGGPVTYYWDDGVLMRRWRPEVNGDVLAVHQLVLPSAYHPQVLKLAHEHLLSGHLGITNHAFTPHLKVFLLAWIEEQCSELLPSLPWLPNLR